MPLKNVTKLCGAKSKRSGQQCQNPAVRDNRCCRMHGGKSLSGRAHPNYKDGRFSVPKDIFSWIEVNKQKQRNLFLKQTIKYEELIEKVRLSKKREPTANELIKILKVAMTL